MENTSDSFMPGSLLFCMKSKKSVCYSVADNTGVDNKNIRDMFRLMTEFGFDFIINSQVLWGDCDTLDALAIYQLIRPGNAKFVTVMPYLWNGKKKELLEREEEVEQRGAEIGQQ